MKFCKVDGRVMSRDTTMGYVVYKCTSCSYEEIGTVDDTCIKRVVFGTKETTEKYADLIKFAPFDRTNQQVDKLCTLCGRTYMTQLRIGESEIIINRCVCN